MMEGHLNDIIAEESLSREEGGLDSVSVSGLGTEGAGVFGSRSDPGREQRHLIIH
jgi:hypothetical protein